MFAESGARGGRGTTRIGWTHPRQPLPCAAPAMPAPFVSVLDRMRSTWDEHARRDALAAASGSERPLDEATFARAGETLMADLIVPQLTRIATSTEAGARTALDVGCGPGRLLRPLAARFASVHGVDVSGVMLAVARQRLRDVENVRLHRGDGMTLQCVRRHAFDFAIAHDVLSHLPDAALQVYLLRQIGQRLLPGGTLLVWDRAPREVEALDMLLRGSGLSHVASSEDRRTFVATPAALER